MISLFLVHIPPRLHSTDMGFYLLITDWWFGGCYCLNLVRFSEIPSQYMSGSNYIYFLYYISSLRSKNLRSQKERPAAKVNYGDAHHQTSATSYAIHGHSLQLPKACIFFRASLIASDLWTSALTLLPPPSLTLPVAYLLLGVFVFPERVLSYVMNDGDLRILSPFDFSEYISSNFQVTTYRHRP
jgi:hypothetical protein